ncbi:hypothetical protein EMGBD4_10910 [Verrucomicrobiota bacterium]|nr:hypothetical protein EMGBD4_10910 [Verrucomicrobiota bacterium]
MASATRRLRLARQGAGTWVKEDPKVAEQAKRLETEQRNFEKLRKEAEAAVFAKPAAGSPARAMLLPACASMKRPSSA